MTDSAASARSNGATRVVVRALQDSDIPVLAKHSEQPSQDFYTTALQRVDWSERKVRVFVAEVCETGEVAGSMLLGLGYPGYFPKLDDDSVKQLYLAHIEVLPAFQRRGIGLQLLQFIRQEAASLRADVVRAECAKGWLVDAFYAKIGLEPVPYAGTHDAYPDSQQMLELWLNAGARAVVPTTAVAARSS